MDFVEEQAVSIVANGNFNPAIFQPAWLASRGVITDEESDGAEIEIIHDEICKFKVSSVQFDVRTNRFVMNALAEPFVKIIDIFAQIFGEFLVHTPIRSVGINYGAHFQLVDWKQRNRLGRALAPVEPWGPLSSEFEATDEEMVGGITSLSMKATQPKIGPKCSVGVTIQPSTVVGNSKGVFININNHFQIDDIETAIQWSEIIVSNYDSSMKKSRDILEYFIKFGRGI